MAGTLEQALQAHQSGDLDAAIDAYQALIDADPGNADAWHLMGVAAHQKGEHDLGAELIDVALSIRPDVPDYLSNLGMALQAAGKTDEAEAALTRALQIEPAHGKALANMAGIKRRAGALEDAVAFAGHAADAAPDDPEVHVNLGNALKDLGRVAEAIASYRRATEISPDYPLAHWNLGLALLLAADYPAGFEELAWRWQWGGYPSPRRNFAQPVWDGEERTGQTLLIHTEQGLGDAIQLLRYAPLVRQRVGTVVVEAPGALVPLLVEQDLGDQIITNGDTLPQFDIHVPIFDLPRVFGTAVDNVPAPTLYKVAELNRDVLALDGLRVGLSWHGNRVSELERQRALPLDVFARLGEVPGVRWVNLQKLDNPGELEEVPSNFGIIDLKPEPITRAAAIVAALDLVITSDTFVAHLAGTLGKPVWVALPSVPDWRWHLSGEASIWYPSARLFRQPTAGDWAAVAEAMLAALTDRAADGA